MLNHNIFLLPIRVYYEDTDAGGVVYHSNYISFFERARTEWLRQLGYELDELAQDEGVLFVVRAVTCDYLRPALFNNELFVSAEIRELGKTSIQFTQKVMRAAKESDPEWDKETCIVLAEGTVTVVSVSVDKFRPKRIPKKLYETMKGM